MPCVTQNCLPKIIPSTQCQHQGFRSSFLVFGPVFKVVVCASFLWTVGLKSLDDWHDCYFCFLRFIMTLKPFMDTSASSHEKIFAVLWCVMFSLWLHSLVLDLGQWKPCCCQVQRNEWNANQSSTRGKSNTKARANWNISEVSQDT